VYGIGRMTGRNQNTQRKFCPSATLSNTNPTGTGIELNQGLCSDKPVTNSLSCGTLARSFFLS
jgi:hypothetical protein